MTILKSDPRRATADTSIDVELKRPKTFGRSGSFSNNQALALTKQSSQLESVLLARLSHIHLGGDATMRVMGCLDGIRRKS
ncbi:MAG: hypothetical protein ACM3ZE_27640 [Myxococcales bacterium]